MKNTWKLGDFTRTEIREYITDRCVDRYDLKEMLDLVESTYLQLQKDNLWYEVDTGITYKGAGWISKPSQSPDPEDILISREEVLKWVFGGEVYCDIARQINIRRMA